MDRFLSEIDALINEYSSSIYVIERIVFTGQYQFISKHFEVLSVHSIPIMYSIWEGFIQKAFCLYIDALNRANVRLQDVADNILVVHMENSFQQFNDYPKIIDRNKKALFLKNLYNMHKHDILKIKPIINTKSNVSFKILNKLLSDFALEQLECSRDIDGKYIDLSQIMKDFLRYRNSISHGGDIFSEKKLTRQEYDKYKELVLGLMYEVYKKMKYGLEHRTYIRKL